ncbi:MAG: DUF6526 family protein [Candidatus Hydrogenedentota bacterium]
MSEETGQNLANHPKVPKDIMVIFGLALVGIILSVVSLFAESILFLKLAALFLGLAIAVLAFVARTYCTKLQDRIIRTEMKIRLRDVVEADLATRADGLTISQLVGLRFASDAEMAGLLTKVLDENIASGGEIKKLVMDWQGDYFRV